AILLSFLPGFPAGEVLPRFCRPQARTCREPIRHSAPGDLRHSAMPAEGKGRSLLWIRSYLVRLSPSLVEVLIARQEAPLFHQLGRSAAGSTRVPAGQDRESRSVTLSGNEAEAGESLRQRSRQGKRQRDRRRARVSDVADQRREQELQGVLVVLGQEVDAVD